MSGGRRSSGIVQVITAWAASCADVRAVAVVGSWARRDAGMDSVVDVVVLTDATWRYVESNDWIESAVGERASVSRERDWGPLLKERRLLLGSGLEIEFGFASLSWASTDPLDEGTAGVIRNGCRRCLTLTEFSRPSSGRSADPRRRAGRAHSPGQPARGQSALSGTPIIHSTPRFRPGGVPLPRL